MKETKKPVPTKPGTIQRFWWYMFQLIANHYNWPGNPAHGLLWPLETEAEEGRLKNKINEFVFLNCNQTWPLSQADALTGALFCDMLELPIKNIEGEGTNE